MGSLGLRRAQVARSAGEPRPGLVNPLEVSDVECRAGDLAEPVLHVHRGQNAGRKDDREALEASGQSPGEPLLIRPFLVVRAEYLLAPAVGQEARPAVLAQSSDLGIEEGRELR